MEHDGYYILNHKPLVVSCVGNYAREDPMPALPGWLQPGVEIEHASWYQGYRYAMKKNRLRQERLAESGMEHHLLVNSPEEEEMRVTCGVRGGLFSRNQFVSEFIFRPQQVRVRHDAIYVARLRPFKRHALAKNVSSLLILTDHGEDVPAFCPDVGHAEFNPRRLSRRKVSERINEARVGLCLSREEGAMRASVEYLLCGRPVVTTESRGGREVFFDEMNSITVPPDPAAVAEAVNTWKEREPDAEHVRSRTLARLKSIRSAYCDYLGLLFSRIGAGSISSDDLYESYFGPGQGLNSRFLSRRQLRVPQRLDEFALERTEHRNGSPNPQ